jgi:acyl-CoA synthetase (AMP-forming)/AMP-acid ligase II
MSRSRPLANAYRVLLTRARQVIAIYAPKGDSDDPTRQPDLCQKSWSFPSGVESRNCKNIGCYNGWFPFLHAAGCTIFMEHFDLGQLVKKVAALRATHVFLTPTLWRRLLNADAPGADFSSVRLIGFAAEPMDAPTLKRLRERINSNVVQMYGSTEAGAAATCITADEMVGERLVSCRSSDAQRRPADCRARRQLNG